MRIKIALEFGADVGPRHATIEEDVTVAHAERSRGGAAEIDGGGDECLEDRVEIKSRAADHLQHIRRRRLLGERIFEVARAHLNLVEQADVFNGDDRLIGEGPNQFDLAWREWAWRRARQDKNANHLLIAQKRDREVRAVATEALALG